MTGFTGLRALFNLAPKPNNRVPRSPGKAGCKSRSTTGELLTGRVGSLADPISDRLGVVGAEAWFVERHG